jgi:pimeloyl-ACP methyl ester carboxylesterase
VLLPEASASTPPLHGPHRQVSPGVHRHGYAAPLGDRGKARNPARSSTRSARKWPGTPGGDVRQLRSWPYRSMPGEQTGTLTIDAMADQTSALIDTLGLSRPDVLGWPMGGMIAQALAVLHPAQVRRLVLCATYPGTGPVAAPSQVALQPGSDFPVNQVKAYDAFKAAVAEYPAAPPAPIAAKTAQAGALADWWDGSDATGRKITRISVPRSSPTVRRPARPGRQRPRSAPPHPRGKTGALLRRRAWLPVPGRNELRFPRRVVLYRSPKLVALESRSRPPGPANVPAHRSSSG